MAASRSLGGRARLARAGASAIASSLAGLPSCSAPAEAQPELAGPTVVDTVPNDGEVGVDTEIGSLSVTFSETMEPAGWSWVTEAGRSAPVVTGLPVFVDERTNVMPVRLTPQTSYVVWVNSPDDAQLRKFANPEGIPATAYRIRFTTGD